MPMVERGHGLVLKQALVGYTPKALGVARPSEFLLSDAPSPSKSRSYDAGLIEVPLEVPLNKLRRISRTSRVAIYRLKSLTSRHTRPLVEIHIVTT